MERDSLLQDMLDAENLHDFKKEIKRENNGRKIHQVLPLQFRKSLSYKLLEVKGLFQGSITPYFSWFYPQHPPSASTEGILSPFYTELNLSLHQRL